MVKKYHFIIRLVLVVQNPIEMRALGPGFNTLFPDNRGLSVCSYSVFQKKGWETLINDDEYHLGLSFVSHD